MAKIPEYFNVGSREDLTPERLLILMEEMYKQLAVAVNQKPNVYERDTDGLTTDSFLSNGDLNINSSTNKVEMLTNRTSPSAVIWTTLS